MSEEKKITYSWGPLYETLKEMYDKGDPHEDPLFTRAFELFSLLDNAQTLEKVREILKEKCTFTQMEINRINSPCLDGILYTINSEDPFQELVRNYWKYIETCKFYTNFRKELACPLFMACVNGRTDLVKLFLPFEKTRLREPKPDRHKYLYHACIYGYTDIIKLLVEEGATMTDDNFRQISFRTNLEIVKLVYSPDFSLYWPIIQCCVKHKIEEVKFLLEKNPNIVTPQMYTKIADRGGTTEEILQLLRSVT